MSSSSSSSSSYSSNSSRNNHCVHPHDHFSPSGVRCERILHEDAVSSIVKRDVHAEIDLSNVVTLVSEVASAAATGGTMGIVTRLGLTAAADSKFVLTVALSSINEHYSHACDATLPEDEYGDRLHVHFHLARDVTEKNAILAFIKAGKIAHSTTFKLEVYKEHTGRHHQPAKRRDVEPLRQESAAQEAALLQLVLTCISQASRAELKWSYQSDMMSKALISLLKHLSRSFSFSSTLGTRAAVQGVLVEINNLYTNLNCPSSFTFQFLRSVISSWDKTENKSRLLLYTNRIAIYTTMLQTEMAAEKDMLDYQAAKAREALIPDEGARKAAIDARREKQNVDDALAAALARIRAKTYRETLARVEESEGNDLERLTQEAGNLSAERLSQETGNVSAESLAQEAGVLVNHLTQLSVMSRARRKAPAKHQQLKHSFPPSPLPSGCPMPLLTAHKFQVVDVCEDKQKHGEYLYVLTITGLKGYIHRDFLQDVE